MYECNFSFTARPQQNRPPHWTAWSTPSVPWSVAGKRKRPTHPSEPLSFTLTHPTDHPTFWFGNEEFLHDENDFSPKSIFSTKCTESQQNFTIPVQRASIAVDCIVKLSRNSPFWMFSARISARHQKSTYTPFACTEAKETDVAKIPQMLAERGKLGSATGTLRPVWNLAFRSVPSAWCAEGLKAVLRFIHEKKISENKMKIIQ